MSERPIVVGVDGSDASIAALRRARELASALKRPVVVLVAWRYSLFSGDGTSGPDLWGPLGDSRRAAEHAVHAVYGDRIPRSVSVELVDGAPAHELIRASEHASMVVVASRGIGGFRGLLLGSVGATVAEHAHCPVLIVREP